MKPVLRSTLYLLIPVLLAACATPPPAPVNYPAPAPAPASTSTSAPTAPTAAPRQPSVAPTAAPAPAPAVVEPSAAERALVAAISAYDRGEYGQAIRLLTPLTNEGGLDAEQQMRALKTLAFSQCSTNAVTACRQTFERAFRADPRFDLAVAERGHPIWGPQFERARKTVTGK